MKRNIEYITLLIAGVVCFFCIAAAPQQVGGQVIVFNEADQETTASWSISAVAWTSDQTSEMVADNDMLLEDGAGVRIAGARAEATADDYIVSFPIPIRVSGLKAEDLDGGILYIYGQRR